MGGASRMFAACLPGLAPLLRREADLLPGVRTTGSGFDGRADVVTFDADRGCRPGAGSLRTAEDVFIETGRARRSDGDSCQRLAAALWQPQRAERALSIWAEQQRRPLAGTMTFRVVTRVLAEGTFRRTDLRAALWLAIRRDRRKWTAADPAQLEIWACEFRPGEFISGLRLSDARMRQHGGRRVERPGALRPTLAAAMVGLAGDPPGPPSGEATGILLDPCCGAGTILAEAARAGWTAAGIDIDADAVLAARANVPSATVSMGDARHLNLPDGSVAACVANLPFGRQYQVPAEISSWLAAVLREQARVLRPGGQAVLLTPGRVDRAAHGSLTAAGRFPVRVLGVRTTIWCLEQPTAGRPEPGPGRPVLSVPCC